MHLTRKKVWRSQWSERFQAGHNRSNIIKEEVKTYKIGNFRVWDLMKIQNHEARSRFEISRKDISLG